MVFFRGTHHRGVSFLSGLACTLLGSHLCMKLADAAHWHLSDAGEGRAYFQEFCLPALVGLGGELAICTFSP